MAILSVMQWSLQSTASTSNEPAMIRPWFGVDNPIASSKCSEWLPIGKNDSPLCLMFSCLFEQIKWKQSPMLIWFEKYWIADSPMEDLHASNRLQPTLLELNLSQFDESEGIEFQ